MNSYKCFCNFSIEYCNVLNKVRQSYLPIPALLLLSPLLFFSSLCTAHALSAWHHCHQGFSVDKWPLLMWHLEDETSDSVLGGSWNEEEQWVKTDQGSYSGAKIDLLSGIGKAKRPRNYLERNRCLKNTHFVWGREGITAHFTDKDWTLLSFALTVSKTEEQHYAEACAEHFLDVANKWETKEKLTTLGTDSALNMVAATRLPFEHLPCMAQSLQRMVTVSLNDNGFQSVQAKCCKCRLSGTLSIVHLTLRN